MKNLLFTPILNNIEHLKNHSPPTIYLHQSTTIKPDVSLFGSKLAT